MPKESAYFTLRNINGKHGYKEIKKELGVVPGVISVSVSDNHVAVDYDNSGVQKRELEDKINGMGYDILVDKAEEHIM